MSTHTRHRWSKLLSLAGALALAVLPLAITPAANAKPEGYDGCSVKDFNDGKCLIGMPEPRESPLASAVRAAVNSGRSDIVDKYLAQLPANTPESRRSEIAAARATALARSATPPQAESLGGGIVPFGGNSGTIENNWKWSIDDHRPIIRCPGDGADCTQIDWNDIHFEYNIYFTSEVTMFGSMQARDGIGTYGVKNFTCQLKADKSLAIDPVRASFTNCVGAPKTKSLMILDQTRSHTYTNELNWLNIKFESYDATYGISFGNVEYKSPNFKKDSSGAQSFSY